MGVRACGRLICVGCVVAWVCRRVGVVAFKKVALPMDYVSSHYCKVTIRPFNHIKTIYMNSFWTPDLEDIPFAYAALERFETREK